MRKRARLEGSKGTDKRTSNPTPVASTSSRQLTASSDRPNRTWEAAGGAARGVRDCGGGACSGVARAAPQESAPDTCTAHSSQTTASLLLQSNERCDFSVEETVSQAVCDSELEIGSEESTHFIVFREGEEGEKEQEESLSAPRLKCSLRENKCQTFICSFCLQSFTSKYRLIMHVFVHIDGVEPPKSVCKSCGEVFPSYVTLRKHLQISKAEQDLSADKEETFDCSGKSFTHLRTLKGHALIDTESRTHKCDICGKSYTRLSSLKRHALIHTKIQPKCDICGKSFTRLSYLKRHALIHTRTTFHKCNICGKCFTQSSHLRSHALLHTGTKLQKCKICGKSFTQLITLKSHALLHIRTKPHKCDICGESFMQLSSLKRHSLLHEVFVLHKCDICENRYTRLSDLKRHALIHTGILPHKCDICGDSFTRLSYLKRHALKHTRTTFHKCNICGKCFTQSSDFRSHALIHTGTKLQK